MRKIGYLAALGLLALPLSQDAQAADDGKVYYKGGSVLEFPDFKMKINSQIQTIYQYKEFEESEAREEDDTSGFDVKRARLQVSGDALGGMWSYRLQNDFASDSGGGDLKDAWLQLNLDEAAMMRMGQFKEPFSRQAVASSAAQQLVDRSIVTNTFARGRDVGAMLHGAVSESLGYSLAVFNGESEGEGANKNATDNNLKGVAQLVAFMGDYGDRGHEGDHRDGGDFAMTFGAAAAYGEGQDENGVEGDAVDLNADVGVRVQGASLQGEYFWTENNPDGGDSTDLNGFYVQGGMMFGDWEPVARYGWVDPDGEEGIDELTEYAVGINYFFAGHSLKATAQVTWEDTEFLDNTELTDTRAELQLTAYL